jgi:hypothetical protein
VGTPLSALLGQFIQRQTSIELQLERLRPPTEASMKPETRQSLKQSAISLGLVFAGFIVLWVLVAGLGL